MKKTPCITLVGAGPRAPDLITLKGIRALQCADAVLYDALVHPELLDFAPASATRVFVGKRRGFCEFAQAAINQLIVDYAESHGHVVRLKGGDPFVFGRGYEELLFARMHGINVTVVPGLSSSYAVPALAGIPLTCRGVSEPFWVITGTTKDHQLSDDIRTAALTNATLVILMGMKHLPDIVQILTDEGKYGLPVAVIQNGSWASEKMAMGTISSITADVEQAGLTNPAIIVIGEVVRSSENQNLIDAIAGLKMASLQEA